MSKVLITDKDLRENIGKRVSYVYAGETYDGVIGIDADGDIHISESYIIVGDNTYENDNNGVTNITLLDEPNTEPTEELYELDPSKCRKVLVRDSESADWQERILVTSLSNGKAICVQGGYEEYFLKGKTFYTKVWNHYKEIPTEPKEEFIPFDTVEELRSLRNKWFREIGFPNQYKCISLNEEYLTVSFIVRASIYCFDLKELFDGYEMLDEETNEWVIVGKRNG